MHRESGELDRVAVAKRTAKELTELILNAFDLATACGWTPPADWDEEHRPSEVRR
jgi:hypothetical protein